MKNPIDDTVPKALYAFPWTASLPDGQGGTYWSVCPGMTLRDHFAGQAMAGWLASFSSVEDAGDVHAVGVAKFAYEMADAMLKAREQ